MNSGYSHLAKNISLGVCCPIFLWDFKQIEDIKQLEDLALLKFEIYFALFFIVLLLIRFVYMKRTQRSSLPPDTPKAQKTLAKLVHYGMYAGMVSIALSGLMIGCFYWVGLKGGLLVNFLISWHETSVSTVYWLIGLHFVGAIFHRFKKDEVWDSMVPILQSKK